MKMLSRIGLFLTAALIFCQVCAAAGAAFSIEGVDSYTISGNQDMIIPVTVSQPEALEKIEALLNSAQNVPSIPSAAALIASLEVAYSQGTVKFSLYDDGTALYLKSGSQLASIQRASFFDALRTNPGRKLYRYSAIPTLTVGDDSAQPTESNYLYIRLDGSRCLASLPQGEIPEIHSADGRLPSFSAEQAYKSMSVQVTKDNDEIYSGSASGARSLILPDIGVYQVQTTVLYDHDLYKGTVTYAHKVNNLPAAGFEIVHSSLFPGEVALLKAYSIPEGQAISVTGSIGFTPHFFEDEPGVQVALMPISYNTSLGKHTITLQSGDISESFIIIANDKDFQIQHLTADKATTEQTIASQKANQEFDNTILPLRSVNDSVRYWKDAFVMPVSDSKITTEFGCIRYTNGSSTPSRHGGIDLAVPRGTTVAAPANGRVLYSGYLQLTGNTILIEHGYGLKSWYYHMDSTNVRTGDMVVQGQKIGEVGSTGFSTGPHLHFAMSVNNVFVDPYQFVNNSPLN